MHRFQKIQFVTGLLLITASPFINCSSEQQDCDSLKNGRFYYYPKTSAMKYIIIRQDSLQKEINTNTGDTSYWKVNWIQNCILTTRFMYGSTPELTRSLSHGHLVFIQILEVKKDYYVFKGSLDSLTSKYIISDTIWMNSK